jgi:hypothetical protein
MNSLPAMGNLSSEDDCARCIIDQRKSCRSAAGINLDPQWLHPWHIHRTFQHDGKRVAL